MKRKFAIILIAISLYIDNNQSVAQILGSNFLSALRGYGSDMCRFISCPFGQYCLNGVCVGGGVGAAQNFGPGMGLFGAASKICAETVDCYSGQTCIDGRCTLNSYLGDTIPRIGSPAALAALDPATSAIGAQPYYPSSSIMPYGAYSGELTSLIDRPSGVQMCARMQHCLNGQICVNGYCSQSNVAYGGSQVFKPISTCSTGAICPVGQYCLFGVCTQNQFQHTTACFGTTCPPGMYCQFGRCHQTMFYGKKK